MAEVKNIPQCGVNFSDALSACDTCKIIMSTQQEACLEPCRFIFAFDLLGYSPLVITLSVVFIRIFPCKVLFHVFVNV